MKCFAQIVLAVSALLVLLAPAREAPAQVRMDAEAYPGTPFGVGRVTIHSGGEFRINRVPRPAGAGWPTWRGASSTRPAKEIPRSSKVPSSR